MPNAYDILKGCNILIVEDEALIALGLIDILENRGASAIGPIARVKDILPAMLQEEPDVVILDLNLHGQSTQPIAKILIAMRIPVIVSTGYVKTDIAAQLPGVPILEKPYNLEDVVEAVSAVFKGRQDLPHPGGAAKHVS